LAVDQKKHVYNIEIQRSDHGAGVKRARYNSSLIDANVTEPGEQYEALNESYVIFITENDVLKKGFPIYHIERMVTETGEPFGDEEHIVYVNSQIKDEPSLGKLMHDFACIDAKDMYYHVLADRVRYFKEDEKGVTVMCKAIKMARLLHLDVSLLTSSREPPIFCPFVRGNCSTAFFGSRKLIYTLLYVRGNCSTA
jgi:hypothetical protein